MYKNPTENSERPKSPPSERIYIFDFKKTEKNKKMNTSR